MRSSTDRRQRTRPALRWPERRTGFDRRRAYPITATLRDRPSVLLGVLVVFNALGLGDWFLTLNALESLGAIEANPVMRAAYLAGPWEALAIKLVALAFVTAGIVMLRRYRAVLLVAAGASAAYVALTVYHLAGIVSAL